MTKEEKDILEQWLQKASHDLIAAEILIEASPVILDIACFHCHQSIEKYLKTFLIYYNHEFEYTHNLDYLTNECAVFDNDFKDLDMKNMNVYAVRARYPHDHIAPELSEAKEYYQIALTVKTLVLKKINIDLP